MTTKRARKGKTPRRQTPTATPRRGVKSQSRKGVKSPRRSTPKQPNTTRADTKKAIRERIVKAALSLFQAKGFDATTTKAIARKAGIAEGTIEWVGKAGWSGLGRIDLEGPANAGTKGQMYRLLSTRRSREVTNIIGRLAYSVIQPDGR